MQESKKYAWRVPDKESPVAELEENRASGSEIRDLRGKLDNIEPYISHHMS